MTTDLALPDTLAGDSGEFIITREMLDNISGSEVVRFDEAVRAWMDQHPDIEVWQHTSNNLNGGIRITWNRRTHESQEATALAEDPNNRSPR